jgi:hypothetical protein
MKLPNRDDIVKEALEEISPTAEKKSDCEKMIRKYLGLLDDVDQVRSEKEKEWPSPAKMRRDMDRLAKALKKVETILLLPTYQRVFRHMPAYLDYDRFMADMRKVFKTADFQVKHSLPPRGSKPVDSVKVYAAIYAVRLFEQFRSKRRGSQATLAASLYEGATGIEGEDLGKYCAKVERKPPNVAK